MSEHIHPGHGLDVDLRPDLHLDADQLNAFAEGALPEHERLQAMAHLAECSHCREIVFLAQESLADALPQAAPDVVIERVPFWRRWLAPLPLVGSAVLASAILAVVLWRSQSMRTPPSPPEVAVADQPLRGTPQQPAPTLEREEPAQPPAQLPAPSRTSTAPVIPSRAEPKAATANANQPVIAGSMAGEVSAAVPAAGLAAPSAAPPLPPNGSDATSLNRLSAAPQAQVKARRAAVLPLQAQNSGEEARQQAAAPAAAAAPMNSTVQVLNGTLQQLPSTGRDVSSLDVVSAGAAVSNGGPIQVRIEHGAADGNGPATGSSTVTGLVTDAAGAVVPKAAVTLRALADAVATQAAVNGAKQLSKQTVTDGLGRFTLSALQPGRYELQIASPGFSTVSQQLYLQAHDVAQLTSVLPVGAASEAVEVSAAGVMSTEALADTAVAGQRQGGLPSDLPAVTTVTSSDKMVAMDSAGTLFVRRGTHHWKRVKAPWPDKVRRLTLVPPAQASARLAKQSQPTLQAPVFQLTTVSGEVWVSMDGEHWRPQ